MGQRLTTRPPLSKLVLASASPRRREIIRELGLDFEVLQPGVDESAFELMAPSRHAAAAARAKTEAVRRRRPSAWIVGCDTVVAVDGRTLGKPASADEAIQMLRLLSARVHTVVSAVCVAWPDGLEVATGVSRVRFTGLSPAAIRAYIATGEPLDKAGGYGIQGAAAKFAALERGRLDTVVGLPTHVLLRLLRRSGYRPSQSVSRGRGVGFANLGRLR